MAATPKIPPNLTTPEGATMVFSESKKTIFSFGFSVSFALLIGVFYSQNASAESDLICTQKNDVHVDEYIKFRDKTGGTQGVASIQSRSKIIQCSGDVKDKYVSDKPAAIVSSLYLNSDSTQLRGGISDRFVKETFHSIKCLHGGGYEKIKTDSGESFSEISNWVESNCSMDSSSSD